ncbi:MAG: hypothetical protein ACXABK_00290 [Candidatus Heimdallarchaeaceae archaeon]|jgi:hypothetical protein
MHVGFIVKPLSDKELNEKTIKVSVEDREMFPNDGILFFIESYDEVYGSHITKQGEITGLDEWFENTPIKKDDILILSKYSEGYYLSTTSEIVKYQTNFAVEMDRILSMGPHDILCPNCRYNLEHAGKGSRDDSFILKCARCGFTLVKKSYFNDS